MVEKIIKTLTKRRHFWRFASFSEVAELYTARLMRTIAINVGAAFMSVYMLQNGYSVVAVSFFWAAYFGFKVLISMPLTQLIANIGAKKSILISNFLYIPSMIAFIFLPELGIWALVLTGAFQAISAFMYDVGYLINFSRVKSVEKAGREVALMNIMEKVARAISPLIGGLIAMFIDPRASIAASTIFFVLAAWPMMRAKDSMTTGFSLKPRHFPWRMAARSLLIQLPIGFDVYASGNAWSIFLAVLIFTSGSTQVYAELGAITSIVLMISLAATYAFGKLIDNSSGARLLFWSAAANIVVHISRIFVRTPILAVGTNAVKEVAATGYSMAFIRGMFDVADRSGYRVLYMGLSQLWSNAGAALAALALSLAVLALDTATGFTVFYLLTAAIVAFIALSRFKIYGQN